MKSHNKQSIPTTLMGVSLMIGVGMATFTYPGQLRMEFDCGTQFIEGMHRNIYVFVVDGPLFSSSHLPFP